MTKKLSQVLAANAVRRLSQEEELNLQPERLLRMRWVLTWKYTEGGDRKAKAKLVILVYQHPELTSVPTSAPTLGKMCRHFVTSSMCTAQTSPQPPDSLMTELKPINQSPSPSNYRSQQLPTRCHQPGDTNSNAPRPPSSLATEREPNAKAQTQQSRTATATTMPSTRRHQLSNAPRPPSSLTTELSPKPEPTPSNHKQQLPPRCHQPDDINY